MRRAVDGQHIAGTVQDQNLIRADGEKRDDHGALLQNQRPMAVRPGGASAVSLNVE
jgi:hypothetical protein